MVLCRYVVDRHTACYNSVRFISGMPGKGEKRLGKFFSSCKKNAIKNPGIDWGRGAPLIARGRSADCWRVAGH